MKAKAKLILIHLDEDPSWDLTESQTETFLNELCILRGMLKQDLPKEKPSGYKGISVNLSDYEQIIIYDRVVAVTEFTKVMYLVDETRNLERWLFDTSKNKIPDEIFNQISIREFS